MNKFGFYRLGLLTPRVVVNDPIANADEILRALEEPDLKKCDVVCTPELSIPSYSALKLFHNRELQQETARQVRRIAESVNPNQLLVVGCHVPLSHATFNCAAIINQSRVIAAIPKEFLPNCHEFEEGQWFAAAREDEIPDTIDYAGFRGIPFSTRALFKAEARSIATKKVKSVQDAPPLEGFEAILFIELCQAIWEPIPPSSFACLAGANFVLNPSASPETVGKQEIRRVHVQSQSGRCMCVYGYCSSGPTESTSDVVMGGHNIIAECGSILDESRRVGDGEKPQRDTYWIVQDVDVERCQTERRMETSFVEGRKFVANTPFKTIPFRVELKEPNDLKRFVPALPFVPKVGPRLDARCAEVTGIMQCGLMKRLEAIGAPAKVPTLMIGLSGGIDSTLKAIIADLSVRELGLDPSCINAWNMPGFGSTQGPKDNAAVMIQEFGFSGDVVDIRLACLDQWKHYARMRGYKPFGKINLMDDAFAGSTNLEQLDVFVKALRELNPEDRQHDLIFENTQARQRTKLLMDWGFVLGTGDMSELFQGWCTYNADHQSMYNTNAGCPKTLARFLIRYLANKWYSGALRAKLYTVADQIITPELLPPANDGSVAQDTEQTIGPYELIDFLMFEMCRHGFGPEKILYLGDHAQGWEKEGGYTRLERATWMKTHLQRFLEWSQYKRDDVPNGVKIGSVCLSPRSGNWRMASDGSGRIWIQKCDQLIAAAK